MYGWNDGGWGILWMILSWVAIVAVVVLIVRAFSREPSSPASRQRDPREILDERYARGEISEEEYRDRRRVLDETRR
ncbi:MAG TPA: SHOCT domain-containing protein [Actinomycetota bacterium]